MVGSGWVNICTRGVDGVSSHFGDWSPDTDRSDDRSCSAGLRPLAYSLQL